MVVSAHYRLVDDSDLGLGKSVAEVGLQRQALACGFEVALFEGHNLGPARRFGTAHGHLRVPHQDLGRGTGA